MGITRSRLICTRLNAPRMLQISITDESVGWLQKSFAPASFTRQIGRHSWRNSWMNFLAHILVSPLASVYENCSRKLLAFLVLCKYRGKKIRPRARIYLRLNVVTKKRDLRGILLQVYCYDSLKACPYLLKNIQW